MSKLVVILFMLAWLNPLNVQYDSDAKEKERIAKAKVKTQTQWTHDFENGKPKTKGYKSEIAKFDTKGNAVEVTTYNAEGKEITISVYKYDNKDRQTGYERYQNKRDKIQYSQNTVYDANGNKIEESGFDGATAYKNTFKYEANKLAEITYTTANAVVEVRKLKYSGDRVDIEIFNASNVLIYKQQDRYNAKGLLVEETKLEGSGGVVHTINCSYNDGGAMLEETKKRAGNQLEYQKLYQYDNASRPVKEETVTLNDVKFVSHEYSYNSAGDLIVEKWRKSSNVKDVSTKKITYDSKGLYAEIEGFYASYNLHTLYKYTYEFY